MDRNTGDMSMPCMRDIDPAVKGYYMKYRRYPFIAYTEHHIALTLEESLPDSNISPESLFPDPAPLQAIFSTTIDAQTRLDPLQHKLKITSAAAALLQTDLRPENKRSLVQRATDVLKVDQDQEPYPPLIRPIRTYLSIRAILETPQLGQMGSILSSFKDRTDPASKYHISIDLEPPEPFKEDLDEDTILGLKPRFTSIQMAAIQEGRKNIMEWMQKADERRGKTVAKATIWEEWMNATDDMVRRMPQKLRPPLFPLSIPNFARSSNVARLDFEMPELDNDYSRIDVVLASWLAVKGDVDSSLTVDDVEMMGILPQDTLSGIKLDQLKAVTTNITAIAPPSVDRKFEKGGVAPWDRAITMERCQPIQRLLPSDAFDPDGRLLTRFHGCRSHSSSEAAWRQFGHRKGRRDTHDTEKTASTSHDLSAVEDMVVVASGYIDSPVIPDQDIQGRMPVLVKKKQSKLKRSQSAAAQELDAILHKKARYVSGSLNIPTQRFDPAAHIRDHLGAKTGRVLPSATVIQPKRSGLEASPEPMPPSKPSWRSHPSIQNASWYEQALRQRSETEKAKQALATIGMLYNRPLAAALNEEGFECFDEDTATISGVDLIISPTTGLILRTLSAVTGESLMQDIQLAVRYFTRVYVIFEVKSYNLKPQGPDATEDVDPLTPGIIRSLPSFSKEVSRINSDAYQDPFRIGKVAIAYAKNGASEVAKVISAVAGGTQHDSIGDESLGRYWGVEEDELEHRFLINRYASRAILSRFSPLHRFVAEVSSEDKLRYLAPVVGKRIAERFMKLASNEQSRP